MAARLAARPWVLTTGDVGLAVRLTPKGGRDAIDGMQVLANGRSALMVRVRAAPANGEANTALIRLVAKAVGVPPRDVVLVSGATGRLKRRMMSGEDAAHLAALEKIVPPR